MVENKRRSYSTAAKPSQRSQRNTNDNAKYHLKDKTRATSTQDVRNTRPTHAFGQRSQQHTKGIQTPNTVRRTPEPKNRHSTPINMHALTKKPARAPSTKPPAHGAMDAIAGSLIRQSTSTTYRQHICHKNHSSKNKSGYTRLAASATTSIQRIDNQHKKLP